MHDDVQPLRCLGEGGGLHILTASAPVSQREFFSRGWDPLTQHGVMKDGPCSRDPQRRLLTAKRVATSVTNCVLILNSIMLPSIVFTAMVFDIPHWAELELDNSYKQFL